MSTEFTCVVYKSNELVYDHSHFSRNNGENLELWLKTAFPISEGYRYNVRKTNTDVLTPMQYAISAEFDHAVDQIHARVLATEVMSGEHSLESIERKIKVYSEYKRTDFVAFCAFCSFWLKSEGGASCSYYG